MTYGDWFEEATTLDGFSGAFAEFKKMQKVYCPSCDGTYDVPKRVTEKSPMVCPRCKHDQVFAGVN